MTGPCQLDKTVLASLEENAPLPAAPRSSSLKKSKKPGLGERLRRSDKWWVDQEGGAEPGSPGTLWEELVTGAADAATTLRFVCSPRGDQGNQGYHGNQGYLGNQGATNPYCRQRKGAAISICSSKIQWDVLQAKKHILELHIKSA